MCVYTNIIKPQSVLGAENIFGIERAGASGNSNLERDPVILVSLNEIPEEYFFISPIGCIRYTLEFRISPT